MLYYSIINIVIAIILINNNKIVIPMSMIETDKSDILISFDSTDISHYSKFNIKDYIVELDKTMKDEIDNISDNFNLEKILMKIITKKRKETPFDVANFRPMTKNKISAINNLYEKTNL